MRRNLFLIGFSGSGKSTVGREAATRLGWTFVDTDEEIVRRSGSTIEHVFADIGEEGFRDVEHAVLVEISKGERQVVSTGGGIVTSERNRALMSESGVVVCLEARPETIDRRVSTGDDDPVRPMLETKQRGRRIEHLKAERQPFYALADWTVHTDRLTPGAAADEVVRAYATLTVEDHPGYSELDRDDLAAVVRTSSGDCPIWVTSDGLGGVGERARRLIEPGTAYVIADEGSSPHARRVQASLEASGIAAHIFIVPSGSINKGESGKSLKTVELVYRWLAGRRAERGHLVVAVGGGVVGDLAGYVAATFLRGMPFIQVPTTLLAMVDASVGGKTGVDLPQGKNLVGAFHQPRFVLADVRTLKTLPERPLTEGWAEAIKHALAFDEALLAKMEDDARALQALQEPVTDVIRRSVAIKAGIVSRDEHETLGLRMLLNYGHTMGHALEAVTGYARYLHGEAVSVGMMAAGHIAAEMGMLSAPDLARQRSVLETYGLPTTATDVDVDALKAAMLSDKKVRRGRIRWVLLDGLGHAVIRADVPQDAVDGAVSAVFSS